MGCVRVCACFFFFFFGLFLFRSVCFCFFGVLGGGMVVVVISSVWFLS